VIFLGGLRARLFNSNPTAMPLPLNERVEFQRRLTDGDAGSRTHLVAEPQASEAADAAEQHG
jgi:hypothetical protein